MIIISWKHIVRVNAVHCF